MQQSEASLESISLSSYINLVELHVPSNKLTAIDTNSIANLTYLLLSDNQLASIDLSKN